MIVLRLLSSSPSLPYFKAFLLRCYILFLNSGLTFVVFKPESCHICFLSILSIYYTSTFFFFFFFPPLHQFTYLRTESFKMSSSLPPPQLSVSSLNPKETRDHVTTALSQGFPIYLIVSQWSLCCLQLLPLLPYTDISYTLEVATAFEGMLFLFPIISQAVSSTVKIKIPTLPWHVSQ